MILTGCNEKYVKSLSVHAPTDSRAITHSTCLLPRAYTHLHNFQTSFSAIDFITTISTLGHLRWTGENCFGKPAPLSDAKPLRGTLLSRPLLGSTLQIQPRLPDIRSHWPFARKVTVEQRHHLVRYRGGGGIDGAAVPLFGNNGKFGLPTISAKARSNESSINGPVVQIFRL